MLVLGLAASVAAVDYLPSIQEMLDDWDAQRKCPLSVSGAYPTSQIITR